MSTAVINTKPRPLTDAYMWLIIAVGISTCTWSVIHLQTQRVDIFLPILVLATVLLGSRVAIRIPRINTNITVDDTFMFLTLLLYGPEAAALCGMVGGLAAGLRISKRARTVLFA